MKKVVIVNGIAESGKDTFVKQVQELLEDSDIKVQLYSTIDSVKKSAKLLGWDNDKSDKGRQFLHNLKKDWIEYNDGPLKEVITLFQCYYFSLDKFLIFAMIREIEEINKVKDLLDEHCHTVLISKEDTHIPDNYADSNVGNLEYEYIIDNNGTISDLKEKVRVWLKDIL